MNLRSFVLCLVGLLGLTALPPAGAVDISTSPSAVSQKQVTAALAGLAIPFEENQGRATRGLLSRPAP